MTSDLREWRALVEKELAGAAFDKLVHATAEGLAIQPLYTEPGPDPGVPGAAPFVRGRRAAGGFELCLRGRELDEAAELRWFTDDDGRDVVVDREGRERHAVVVSSLPYHDHGADAADELALLLAAGVEALRAAGDARAANPHLVFRIAVGRDTFGELCKLRALRGLWHRVLVACGAGELAPPPLHAVCSARTLTTRDPAVNMLRVTTQVFAAILGGADWITPAAFDDALAESSGLGRRLARNTALILRDESQLGRVLDAGGGSYYLEARTDALARAAWDRFTAIERAGGLAAELASGAVEQRLAAARERRAAAIARKKEPILGVTEFANLDEAPAAARDMPHRDAAAFEALRARVEAVPRDVALIVLGPPAEHRARAGYAEAFFALAGLRAREGATATDIACLCGSDERYAAEAAAAARALREAGCRRIALAGRPGALEAALREAGVDTFIFVGCDVLATLGDLTS